ncbi:MAG: PIN domain-containing protein, partial [Archangium sp.]|nr:PIN domain-containing protein [Archangium sp.]
VILVDTNAWVAHIRASDRQLVELLEQDRVVTCDVVLGELALGIGLPNALRTHLALLPMLPSPSAVETRRAIERRLPVFRASGIGWADAQIIVAAAEAGALLYSSDNAMRAVWRKLGFRLP